MAIDNFQIASWGWFQNPVIALVPSGEEIHGLGWLDGVAVVIPPTPPQDYEYTIRYKPIIPKRNRYR